MIPILWLVIALSVLKMPGHKACFLAWILTALLSMFCWKFPAGNMATATLEGVLNALWPICLVIIAALFTYNLILKTGAMEEIKKMLASVSTDKRVLLLLIGWGFGNFMEGMAGFGIAVAIPGIYAGWYRRGSHRSSRIRKLHMMDVPEEYGGLGLDHMDQAAIVEQIAWADAGVAVTLNGNGLALKPVLLAGNEEQKQKCCDIIINGGFGSFALTEPNAGCDAGARKNYRSPRGR